MSHGQFFPQVSLRGPPPLRHSPSHHADNLQPDPLLGGSVLLPLPSGYRGSQTSDSVVCEENHRAQVLRPLVQDLEGRPDHHLVPGDVLPQPPVGHGTAGIRHNIVS